jgi:amylosucrase
MESQDWINKQAALTLLRLAPRYEAVLSKTSDTTAFKSRLDKEFPRLFGLLHHLYGHRYDFFYHIEQILLTLAQNFAQRPADLKALDVQREAKPNWFQSEQMLGAVAYVDLFAGNLSKMKSKIPYFKEMGVTYLHLMPLFAVPETNNDGGYAISDYRNVNPKIGTMKELAKLASEFRKEGISLVLDFVFNHTSDEHEWAKRALVGEEAYENYYYIFPDRTMPDAYERTLREIFPEQAPGNFTYQAEIGKWVWTSFYNFQWDLNYSNPEVFNAMAGEMLFLANQGVEILRFDALAFIWKQLGTSCESLPEAHMVIQAYNAVVKIVAPALLFKSEAIVHPDAVASYISWEECPLSYNPTLMALLWEALATRNVNLLRSSMAKRYAIPQNCAWVNYVRVHDDIGWTFADEDAQELWINGNHHRHFLNRFYTGDFTGSFATGLPFGYNAKTGDMRISGTGASLAGLEQALERNNAVGIEMAIRRILLIHSVILSTGGIPLLYMGDEIASLNDYSFRQDPEKKEDSRWTHRQTHDWERAEKRHNAQTIEGRVYQGLQKLIQIRKETPAFGEGQVTFFPTQNAQVLGYIRNRSILCLCNFSENSQAINRDTLAAYISFAKPLMNLLTGKTIELEAQLAMQPYEVLWIKYN